MTTHCGKCNGRLTGHHSQSAEFAWMTIHVTVGLVYLRGSMAQGRCAKRWQEGRSTREGMCIFGCTEMPGPFTRGAIEAAGKPDLSENSTHISSGLCSLLPSHLSSSPMSQVSLLSLMREWISPSAWTAGCPIRSLLLHVDLALPPPVCFYSLYKVR